MIPLLLASALMLGTQKPIPFEDRLGAAPHERARYQVALWRLAVNTGDSYQTIGDLTLAAQQKLKEGGIRLLCIQLMEGLATVKQPGRGLTYARLVNLYVITRLKGFDHEATIAMMRFAAQISDH